MVGVVAPIIPEALGLAVELLLLVTFVALLGVLGLYKTTVKPSLLLVASLFNVKIGAFGHGARPLSAVSRLVVNVADGIESALNSGVVASGKAAAVLWHALAKQARWLGEFLHAQALTIEHNWTALLWAFPPAALLWEATKQIRGLPATVRELRRIEAQAISRVRASVHALDAQAEAQWARLGHGIDRVRARLEHDLARAAGAVRARVGRLERDAATTAARLRRIDRTLAAAGAVALVGAALARLGLGFLRCPRFVRAGRQVCGMNAGLLDSLLADTALIVGTVSLVEFAREMQDITGRAAPLVRHFWRAA